MKNTEKNFCGNNSVIVIHIYMKSCMQNITTIVTIFTFIAKIGFSSKNVTTHIITKYVTITMKRTT